MDLPLSKQSAPIGHFYSPASQTSAQMLPWNATAERCSMHTVAVLLIFGMCLAVQEAHSASASNRWSQTDNRGHASLNLLGKLFLMNMENLIIWAEGLLKSGYSAILWLTSSYWFQERAPIEFWMPLYPLKSMQLFGLLLKAEPFGLISG